MKLSCSSLAILATLLLSVSASPVPKKAAATTTAAAAAAASTTAATGTALTAQAYNDFQISSGTAGTAETQANAIFTSINMDDLASVSAADLKIVQGIHDAAEDAETDAFNPAIDAATGDAATALQVRNPDHPFFLSPEHFSPHEPTKLTQNPRQNGKIKNKVLKLTAEVLGLQIEQAQGADEASDITAEQTKLANNVKLDTAAAGQASTAVSFDATS